MTSQASAQLMQLQENIQEAQQAQHELLCGRAFAQVTDQNGETVKYYQADAARLAGYIATLQYQIDQITGAGRRAGGPMGVVF